MQRAARGSYIDQDIAHKSKLRPGCVCVRAAGHLGSTGNWVATRSSPLQARKPPGERKPLPRKPELGEDASLEDRNAAAQEAYNQEGKVLRPPSLRLALEESVRATCGHGMPSNGKADDRTEF